MDALQELLNNLPVRKAAKRSAAQPMPQHCKDRYQQAHEQWFKRKYPKGYADGKYTPTVMPPCNKANGLSLAIEKFIIWEGWNAKGISSAGRYLNGKYIPGRTRRGAADLSATIKGKACHFEIKIGKDKPSIYQLKEQILERKAGGVYEFVKTFEQFLIIYDSL